MNLWHAYHLITEWQIPEPGRMILNFFTLFLVSYVLGLVGLSLRRTSELGKRLAANELVFSCIYFLSLISMTLVALGVPSFFRSDAYALLARGVIVWSAVRVLLVMRQYFNGWRGLHRRCWYSLMDGIHRRPQRDCRDHRC